MNKPRILAVADDKSVLMTCEFALKQSYNVYAVTSAEAMFELLEEIPPELIVLDIIMPGMDGYEAAQILKSDERYKDIPIIFISAMTDEASEAEGFKIGAVDYIYKPFTASQLKRRVDREMYIVKLYKEFKDLETYIHNKINNQEEMP